MSDIPDSANISQESIGFSAFYKTYLSLVDELQSRHLSTKESCKIGLELVNNYFNYTNNNKFAENAGGQVIMGFEAEEE